MPARDQEQALDELYRADPAEFVALRKQLASELRASGDKAGATRIGAARRPSTSAWALNQAARQQPESIEHFLAAGRALHAAQDRAVAGAGESMRDAVRAHRAALDDVVQAALAVLGPRGNDRFREEIVTTLRAASADESVGDDLRRGCLVREAESSTGFPDSAGLTVVPEVVPDRPRPTRARSAPEKRASAQREEAARRASEQAARLAATTARDEAHARAAAADADASRVEVRIDELNAELDRSRAELRDARRRAKAAKAEAAAAAKRARPD